MFAIPPAQLPHLHAIVRRAAKLNGDAHPVWVRIAESRREQANSALLGDSVNTDGPVYVIALRGRFVANDVSRPAGAGAPHGNTIVLVLGRTTLRDLDFGIGDDLPLSKLHNWQPLR